VSLLGYCGSYGIQAAGAYHFGTSAFLNALVFLIAEEISRISWP
jgi:hypothetical protein